MCASLLPCPVCCQPYFSNLEKLRIGLIKAATENLTCPICNDIFMGLDKYTIHLFSHREIGKVENKVNGIVKNTISNSTNSTNTDITATELSNNIVNLAKRPNKIVKSKAKNESSGILNNHVDLCLKVPIYNMSTLPFIRIPDNILPNQIQNEDINAICNVNNSTENKNFTDDSINTISEKCDICGFYFLGRKMLEMHRNLIHNLQGSNSTDKIIKYPCHLCAKEFKMRGSLMVHLRMVHFGMDPNTQKMFDRNDKMKQNQSNSNVVDNEELYSEIKLNHSPKISNSIDLKKSPTHGESEHHSPLGNKQWECDICRKLFTTKYFLKKHKRLHTGEMPYSCNQCSKTFTFQQSYHKHLLYHNDDKPHTCGQCGRSFKELSTLHNHQRIHTGEKPFSCESCGKCFRQRVSYLVHRRIHTGVMPYKCTACDKSFRYKVSQRTHKCTAQPPGMVIRQSGDLVQKLIKNKTEIFEKRTNFIYVGNEIKEISKNRNEHTNNVNAPTTIIEPFKDVFSNNSTQNDGLSNLSNELLQYHNIQPDKIDGKEFMETAARPIICNSALDKCHNNIIDEIVKESVMKMDLPNLDNYSTRDLYSMISPQHIATDDDNLPSPSEKLRELKLSSDNDAIEDIFDENSYFKHGDGSISQYHPLISKDHQACDSLNNQQSSIFLFDKTFN